MACSSQSEIMRRFTADDCYSMRGKRRFYGSVAATTGFAGGASGFATITTDQKKEQQGIAALGCLSGSVSAGAAYMANSYAEDLERFCSDVEDPMRRPTGGTAANPTIIPPPD